MSGRPYGGLPFSSGGPGFTDQARAALGKLDPISRDKIYRAVDGAPSVGGYGASWNRGRPPIFPRNTADPKNGKLAGRLR